MFQITVKILICNFKKRKEKIIILVGKCTTKKVNEICNKQPSLDLSKNNPITSLKKYYYPTLRDKNLLIGFIVVVIKYLKTYLLT